MVNLNNFSSFFVANWKLNGNFKFIDQYITELKVPNDLSKCVVICPMSIHLEFVSNMRNNFHVGAQNVSQYKEGAYTGEISCASLSELEIEFCIVGHSERRKIFNETNVEVNSKLIQLIENDIVPIICIGETLEQKENGKTKAVLAKQLDEGIPESSKSDNTIIAYEPVWAIGTGLTPTFDEINHTHEFIKNHNAKFNNYKVLYGGSVKSKNAKEIITLSNVDGALIGGASLKSDEFTKIIED